MIRFRFDFISTVVRIAVELQSNGSRIQRSSRSRIVVVTVVSLVSFSRLVCRLRAGRRRPPIPNSSWICRLQNACRDQYCTASCLTTAASWSWLRPRRGCSSGLRTPDSWLVLLCDRLFANFTDPRTLRRTTSRFF